MLQLHATICNWSGIFLSLACLPISPLAQPVDRQYNNEHRCPGEISGKDTEVGLPGQGLHAMVRRSLLRIVSGVYREEAYGKYFATTAVLARL